MHDTEGDSSGSEGLQTGQEIFEAGQKHVALEYVTSSSVKDNICTASKVKMQQKDGTGSGPFNNIWDVHPAFMTFGASDSEDNNEKEKPQSSPDPSKRKKSFSIASTAPTPKLRKTPARCDNGDATTWRLQAKKALLDAQSKLALLKRGDLLKATVDVWAKLEEQLASYLEKEGLLVGDDSLKDELTAAKRSVNNTATFVETVHRCTNAPGNEAAAVGSELVCTMEQATANGCEVHQHSVYVIIMRVDFEAILVEHDFTNAANMLFQICEAVLYDQTDSMSVSCIGGSEKRQAMQNELFLLWLKVVSNFTPEGVTALAFRTLSEKFLQHVDATWLMDEKFIAMRASLLVACRVD